MNTKPKQKTMKAKELKAGIIEMIRAHYQAKFPGKKVVVKWN